MNTKTHYIRTASIIGLAGNFILAVLKIIAGVLSNSLALIADGIDSSTDVLISVMTLFVVKIIAKPADKSHPWGHGRAETVATAMLAFALFFTGAQLIINSASGFLSDDHGAAPTLIAGVVTLISIGGKILLALSQYVLGKRADSTMIIANAKNMTSDVFISLSVLIGLIISYFTGTSHADQIIAMLIGAWIIKTSVGIFKETNLELMDGMDDIEPYRVIAEAVGKVRGAYNPHRARVRKVAGLWDIDFDIDVDPDTSVIKAHAISSRVEREIKRRLENVYDIMIHVEPLGGFDSSEESFGLSEEEMLGEIE